MASENQTLERWASQRDPEAFRVLVARYSGMVYATCRRILGNAAEAEDATQECFEALAEVSHSRIRGDAGPWLYGVATRTCLYRLRSERRRRERETAYASEQPSAERVQRCVNWSDIYQYIDEAIADLPEDLRAVVVAHFLCNERHGTIARRLGIPRRTVSHRIRRGVEQLGKALRGKNIVVGVPVLASLLTHNLAEAAVLSTSIPSSLAATLGKLALAHAASAGAGGPPAAAALTMAGVLAMKKLAVVVAIAVAAVVGYMATHTDHLSEKTKAGHAVVQSLAVDGAAAPETAGGGAAAVESPAVEESNTSMDPADASGGETLSISGHVIDPMGAAVPGASVAARAETLNWKKPEISILTDAAGAFEIAGVAAGRYSLGAYSGQSGYGWVEGVEAGADNVLITLESTGRISGMVYDATTNQGIADAALITYRINEEGVTNSDRMLHFLQPPRSDAGGRFEVAVTTPGRFLFLAKAVGYLEVDVVQQTPVVLEAGEHRRDVRIPLMPGLSISGTVYGAAGAPLPGAEVQLINLTRGGNAWDDSVTSREDGTFLLGYAVQPGMSYIVRAAHPQYSSAESGPLTLGPGEHREGVDLQLGQGHKFSGHVVTSDGQGVFGVKVILRPPGKRTFVPIMYCDAITDDAGKFEILNVAAGTYAASVELADGTGGMHTTFYGREFTMPDDADIEEFVIDVGPALEGFISGTVMNTEGQPLGNIVVAAHSGVASGGARTDASGAYRIEGLGGAPKWMMEVFSSPGYEDMMRDDVPVNTENVDFHLRRLAVFSGLVFDAAAREPISQFEARVVPLAWTAYSAADGMFTIPAVQLGNEIEVRANGYQSAKIGPLDAQSLGGAPVEVVLTPGGILSGTVVDAVTGAPLAGARVRVYTPDLKLHHLIEGFGWGELDPITDEAGRFSLTGVPVETPVSLLAWKEGCAFAVVSGAADGVTIELGAGGSIDGVVTRGGVAATYLSLEVCRYPGEEDLIWCKNPVTGTQGEFRLDHLPPGLYRVAVFDSVDGKTHVVWRGQVEIDHNQTIPLEIKLETR